jgi:hypothetical protein
MATALAHPALNRPGLTSPELRGLIVALRRPGRIPGRRRDGHAMAASEVDDRLLHRVSLQARPVQTDAKKSDMGRDLGNIFGESVQESILSRVTLDENLLVHSLISWVADWNSGAL